MTEAFRKWALRVSTVSYPPCYTTGVAGTGRERYERAIQRIVDQIAASEGQALVSDARTDDPTGVPMSGGAEPAGAAKHHE